MAGAGVSKCKGVLFFASVVWVWVCVCVCVCVCVRAGGFVTELLYPSTILLIKNRVLTAKKKCSLRKLSEKSFRDPQTKGISFNVFSQT